MEHERNGEQSRVRECECRQAKELTPEFEGTCGTHFIQYLRLSSTYGARMSLIIRPSSLNLAYSAKAPRISAAVRMNRQFESSTCRGTCTSSASRRASCSSGIDVSVHELQLESYPTRNYYKFLRQFTLSGPNTSSRTQLLSDL